MATAEPASDKVEVTVYVPAVLKEAGLEITDLKGTLGSEELQLVVVSIKEGLILSPFESTVVIEKSKPLYTPKLPVCGWF